MTHPDEGEILALLEGEASGGEGGRLQAHLDSCPSCASQANELGRALEGVGAALLLLDTEPPVDAARAHLRTRLDGGSSRGSAPGRRVPSGGRRAAWLPAALPRAAMIVLFLAGAASAAIPGSPVREWLGRRWNALSEPPAAPQARPLAPEASSVVTGGQPLEAGASLAPEGGAVELWIHDLAPGAEVTVAWVEGDQAGIFAGAGARFRTEAGRIEAWVPAGPVRAELPRSLSTAVVGSDGVVLLRQEGATRELRGDVVRQGESEVVFRASGGEGGRPNTPRP